MLRRTVKAEVRAEMRIAGERVQPPRALRRQRVTLTADEVLLHRLPHEPVSSPVFPRRQYSAFHQKQKAGEQDEWLAHREQGRIRALTACLSFHVETRFQP